MTPDYTLTKAGWPRPQYRGYPVPWVAPQEDLGHVNEGRRLASAGGAICQVCGGDFAYGDECYGFVNQPADFGKLKYGDYLSEVMTDENVVMPLDGAVLHWRCARLSAARCPHILHDTTLICVRVPANDATPMAHESGNMFPTYSVHDTAYVPWPTLGGSP